MFTLLCYHSLLSLFFFFFFFNDTATTEIYTLSLHDALPIFWSRAPVFSPTLIMCTTMGGKTVLPLSGSDRDRKSTRLNSSHLVISYAVFCLKKKKKKDNATTILAIVSI